MGRLLALLIALMAGSWIAWLDQALPESAPIGTAATQFSGERAFADVNFLSAVPHPLGSVANANVRDAIVGRMLRIGLEPEIRPGVGVQQPKWAPDVLIAGRVENIVGVLRGRDPGKPALMLMAHYDSVAGSPGAADDLMGVAAALETVRAIKARGTPARDVIVLVTDGEEAGLLGANHFFRRDPLAKRVGLVMNLEARGSAGRVQMFQTSPQNGGLIRVYQDKTSRPASSSLAVMIYEVMPNDTDLTESLRVGIPGMNYAIIGSQFDYHSATSTSANLSRGSLQEMGSQALAVAGELAFAPTLPGPEPSPVYANLFGDVLLAYPVWFGWVIVVAIAVLLVFAIRWARQSGEFPAADLLRGAGAFAFAGVGTAAILQFARRLTGVDFGFLDQRFLLAQGLRWEWAVMLTALGFMMLCAAELSRTRRWVAALPLVAGLACSAFGELDMIGLVAGVVAGLIGVVTYGRPVSRKGAWAGGLMFCLVLTIAAQILAPAAAFVLAWPLLVAALAAALTATSAKRTLLAMASMTVLAAVALGWEGGISHFAFEGMDLMPLFAVQMLTAAMVLWPLAQPDQGRSPARWIGIGVLALGLGITLVVRSDDPWTPRYPMVTYVGYHVDQDTGRAWRYSLPGHREGWSDRVLAADGGTSQLARQWWWRRPYLRAAARPVTEAAPTIALARDPASGLRLTALAPPDARTLRLDVRASTAAQITALAGVPVSLPLPAGKWVRVNWASAAHGVELAIQPAQAGRLDVRYVAGFDRWPSAATPLPERSADLMPWDDSDSTFVSGTRAFTW
ncbi:MAG: M20/M25/M40 family metallo-hydrolase [Pseudomonadota bacterium]